MIELQKQFIHEKKLPRDVENIFQLFQREVSLPGELQVIGKARQWDFQTTEFRIQVTNDPETKFYRQLSENFVSYKIFNSELTFENFTNEYLEPFLKILSQHEIKNFMRGAHNKSADWSLTIYQKQTERNQIAELVAEATLRITYLCNEDCYFCTQDLSGKHAPLETILYTIDRILDDPRLKEIDRGKIRLTISGGEPLLHPEIISILEYLQQSGCEYVVQTNLAAAMKGDLLSRLMMFKNLIFFISFHAHQRDLYNKITRSQNNYEAVVQGIKEILAKSRQKIEINFVFCEDNLTSFSDYLSFLLKELLSIRRQNILFYYSTLVPGSQKNQQFNHPSYSAIGSAVVANIGFILENEIPLTSISWAWNCELPLCVYEKIMPQALAKVTESRKKKELFYPQTVYVEACNICELRSRCSGIQKSYLDQHGSEEFQALTRESLVNSALLQAFIPD